VQLDKTEIVIRERNFWEVLELALPMLRTHFFPLVWTSALGLVPFAILNYALIGWMARDEYLDYDLVDIPSQFAFCLALLMFLQAPLATSLTTIYLGKVVFLETPDRRQLLAEFRRCFWRLIVCQGIVRGVLPGLGLMLLPHEGEWASFGETMLLMLVVAEAILRAFRPFLNEIILLEQAPLLARGQQQQPIGRRSERLHARGDHLARWLGTCWIVIVLVITIAHALLYLIGFLVGDWHWTEWKTHFILPITIGLVVVFTTVVRFLNYLDTRIRQEGWEVELRMRAEAAKLTGRFGHTLVILLALVGGATARSDAADPGDAAGKALRRANVRWYDPDKDELRSVDAQRTTTTDEAHKSSWDKGVAKSTKGNLDPESSTSIWNLLLTGAGELLQALVYLLLTCLALALIYFLVRFYLRRDLRSASAATAEGSTDLANDPEYQLDNLPFPIQRPVSDLLTAARECYEQGSYGQAMVYYFSFQLVELDRHQWIHLTKGKTNRQYLRELRESPGLSALLFRSMNAFESYFFGHHELQRDDFEDCWNALRDFQRQLLERSAT
jgi:hypothetical protein